MVVDTDTVVDPWTVAEKLLDKKPTFEDAPNYSLVMPSHATIASTAMLAP